MSAFLCFFVSSPAAFAKDESGADESIPLSIGDLEKREFMRKHCARFLVSQRLPGFGTDRVDPQVLQLYREYTRQAAAKSFAPVKTYEVYQRYLENPSEKNLAAYLDAHALGRLKQVGDLLPFLRNPSDLEDLVQAAYLEHLRQLRQEQVQVHSKVGYFTFASLSYLRIRKHLVVYVWRQFLSPVAASQADAAAAFEMTFWKREGDLDPALAQITDNSWLELIGAQEALSANGLPDEAAESHETEALQAAIDSPLMREYVEYFLKRLIETKPGGGAPGSRDPERRRAIREEVIWGRLAQSEGEKVNAEWLADKYEVSRSRIHELERNLTHAMKWQFNQFLLARQLAKRKPQN